MDAIRLAAVRESPLSVDECLAAVSHPGAGGTAVFIGSVRDDDGGRPVLALEYSAHPDTEARLRQVLENVAADLPVLALAAVHRVGPLGVGEPAVIVAASCPHRAEAFAAARRLIEEVKAQLPIWKRQRFGDGAAEWVGSP